MFLASHSWHENNQLLFGNNYTRRSSKSSVSIRNELINEIMQPIINPYIETPLKAQTQYKTYNYVQHVKKPILSV